jgi:hypothetical protein
MALTQNEIGDAGENLAMLRLEKHGIFRVYFLGAKAPVVDFVIEITDEKTPYQALVQVKSTSAKKGYTKKGRMKTKVPIAKLKKLWERPLPTYVIGADVEHEVIYIAPAFENDGPYNSIPPKLKIDNRSLANDKVALNRLKDDIINYYKSHQTPNYKRAYKTTI